MKATSLQFDSAGQVHCLYTEVIPLQSLGSLRLRRASLIEFNHHSQQWEVIDPEGCVRFASPTRQACLDWEHEHLKPEPSTPNPSTNQIP